MPASGCAKCGGTMEDGFILSESSGWPKAAAWIEGAPVRSLWTGLKLGGRRRLTIATARCRRCGVLELSAPA